MRTTEQGRHRCRWSGVLLTLLVLGATGGCQSSAARDDLAQALQDTRTAVRTVTLAVDLLGRGQLTRSAAEVTAGDMVDQIGSTQQQLTSVPAETPALRDLRQRTQLAVATALVAVQDTEDRLAAGGAQGPAVDELAEAEQAVSTLVAVVGEPQ